MDKENPNPFEGNTPELEAGKRQINMFFVRHGQQQDYANPASFLSDEGARQIEEEFADPFITWLEGQDRESVVQVLSSPRTRALQSGLLIRNRIERAIEEGRIQKTSLLSFQAMPDLLQTQPISELLKMGYTNPYATWHELSDDFMALNGIPSPLEVAELTARTIRALSDLSRILGPGPQLNYILVAHETTIGALVRKHFGVNTEIEHGESIGVFLGRSIFFHFRGRMTGDLDGLR